MGALLRSCSGQSPDPSPGISGPQDRLCPGSVTRRRPMAAASFFTSLRRTPILPLSQADLRANEIARNGAIGERRSEFRGNYRARELAAGPSLSQVARRTGFRAMLGKARMGALLRSCSGQSPDPSPGISGPQDRLCPGSVTRRRPMAAASFFTSLRRTPILPLSQADLRANEIARNGAIGERRSEFRGNYRARGRLAGKPVPLR